MAIPMAELTDANQARVLGLRWFLVAVWMALIWYASAQPDLHSGLAQDFLLRKIAHLLEFAVLTGLVQRAIFPVYPRHFLVGALLWALTYSVIDEWHQTSVPGRMGTLQDVGVDFIGIGAATLGRLGYTRFLKRREFS
ncbi:MAG: VanZ family protein [Candidatus Andersenbacteria bacterium]